MPTTFKALYGTYGQSVTFSGLNSLANAASVFSSAIDNSTNLFVDILINGQFTAASSSVSATGTITILIAASYDNNTNFTLRTQDCKVVAVLDCSANSAVPKLDNASVAALYGGHCPQYFKIGVLNNSGTALNSSGNAMTYQGINDQGV